MLFIILALCGWDRSAFHLALKAFDIYFRFSFILIVSVGAFLMLLAIVQPPFDIGTVVFGLIGAIMWGILICNLVLELVHDGIEVKLSCAIVAAAYLLLFALAWYGNRHARSAAAEEATNTERPTERGSDDPNAALYARLQARHEQHNAKLARASSEPEATTEPV